MPDLFQINSDSGAFRLRYDPPAGKLLGTCILIQSGQLGLYDEPVAEAVFYKCLTRSLTRVQIGVLRFDQEPREDPKQAADDTELSRRTERLWQTIRDPRLKSYLDHYVMCGFSLGARSVLQLISARQPGTFLDPQGVVLVGCVVDSPTAVMSNLQTVQLVYGERDYIAYVGNDDETDYVAIPPQEYGRKSLEMLVLRSRQRCDMDIVDGVGHLLLNGDATQQSNSAIPWLTDRIKQIITQNGSFQRAKGALV